MIKDNRETNELREQATTLQTATNQLQHLATHQKSVYTSEREDLSRRQNVTKWK